MLGWRNSNLVEARFLIWSSRNGLLLTSGQTLKVRGIELYPADELGHIAATRAEAARNLGTVSTVFRDCMSSDDFVMVDTEFGLMNVRWSGVVGYVAPSRAASHPPPIPTI
ncbi:hypothetical protein [Bradyrhizobium sp. USDA 4508]